MENYFKKLPSKRKTPCPSSSTSTTNVDNSNPIPPLPPRTSNFTTPINVMDLDDLPSDPFERPRITCYNVNQRDEIRRRYWVKEMKLTKWT